MITISYGGTSYTFANLKDHPLSYSGDETNRGRAVRQWKIDGIVQRADANTIDAIFRAWNTARLPQDDMKLTGVVGATVSFNGAVPGFSWSTPVACHFVAAPSFEMAGIFVQVSFILEDANQRLAVVLRQTEEEAEQTAVFDFGTLSLGGATVYLTTDPDDFSDVPSVSLTPAGTHFISGSLALTDIRRVQGYVSDAHIALLRAWAKANVSTTPAVNDWFLNEWTQPTAIRRADNGVMGDWWNVAFTLVKKR